MAEPPSLVAGPYKSPRVKPGRELAGLVLAARGSIEGPHVVRGLTDAPIPWPWTTASGRRRQLIVYGDLERAIRTESVQAVAYWWGISRWWVERARQALGVPRMNAGTKQIWSDLAATRLGDARPPTKFDDATIDRVRERAAAGEPRALLCKEYGFTRQYLSLLLKGQRRAAK